MSDTVVGLGEILWDLLPGGRLLGGAPANFAYHAGSLGAVAPVVSRVGRDDAGRQLIERLQQLGVVTDGIEVDPVAPTGTVSVDLAADGQPRYTIHQNVAWDFIRGERAGREAVAAADAVCFGTLAQRSETSRQTIQALVRSMRADSLRILDVNLRQHFHSPQVIADSLALANALKVNETELPHLAALFDLPTGERAQIAELARRFSLRLIAHTRGGRGSLLFADGAWSEHPGIPTRVVDTIGAGDSFTAALVLGRLAGWSLDLIHDRAAKVAAYVCSQPGGTPTLPEPLRAEFGGLSNSR